MGCKVASVLCKLLSMAGCGSRAPEDGILAIDDYFRSGYHKV
jgi:hypothetical protein